MRRLVASLALALLLAACSPAPDATAPAANHASTAVTVLGSPDWYAWVDHSLGIDTGRKPGLEPGSAAWNQKVQDMLGQEAPQSAPGSPEWQQSVDALLRTRMPPSS
ncbi:MAG: hypothetical protein WC617_06890 [Rhodanobacter sp.]|jgi:hypothetical protein